MAGAPSRTTGGAESSRWHAWLEHGWIVTGLYLLAVTAIKWPLMLGLATDVPADFGDPSLNLWALTRASVHWTALLSGDVTAATRFWDANIFHPAPLTTAYSEHLAGHALITLPLWWATGNILVSYNVLFLGTAVLCGLGAYLLTRDLTGNGTAAFVAGLCFACAPYRVGTSPQLQVQTAQWMPFAFFALRRFVVSGRITAWAGAVVAIWLQNLASGYYMLFFAPLCGVWAATWLWAEQRWRDLPRVAALVAAAVLTLALTWPFAAPYLALQRQFGGARRSLDELSRYSADLGAWLTASPALNLWGWLQVFPKAQGELFFGLALPVLALIGIASAGRRATTRTHRVTAAFAVGVGLFAAWMALGPRPTALGHPIPLPSLFALAYDYVPGFNVARVASRFQMIVLLCGTMAAAFGAARIRSPWLLASLAVVAVADGAAVPFPRNLVWAPTASLKPPSDRIQPQHPPAVYRYLSTLDMRSAVVHFPFGAPEHDLRYMVYSATHRAPMMNGYSGIEPPHWPTALATLSTPLRDPEATWDYLRTNAITHTVVHPHVWRDDTGARLIAELQARGARTVSEDGNEFVLQLPFASGR